MKSLSPEPRYASGNTLHHGSALFFQKRADRTGTHTKQVDSRAVGGAFSKTNPTLTPFKESKNNFQTAATTHAAGWTTESVPKNLNDSYLSSKGDVVSVGGGGGKGHRRGQSVLNVPKGERLASSSSVFDGTKTKVMSPTRHDTTASTTFVHNDQNFSINMGRERMKTQQAERFKRNSHGLELNHQGGFQSGFIQGKGFDHFKSIQKHNRNVRVMSVQEGESMLGGPIEEAPAKSMAIRGSKMSLKSQKAKKMSLENFLQGYSKTYANLSQPQFLNGYHCQDNSLQEPYYKARNIAISKKAKRENFIDIHIKNNNWQPSAAKYDLIKDWSKNYPGRGKFLKGPKITFTESVLSENKKRPKPAPTSYDFKQYLGKSVKPTAKPTFAAEKFCSFIDQAKWQGHQTPGNKHNVSFHIQDPHLKVAKIYKPSDNQNAKDSRMNRIVRDKTKPAPGEYDTYKSWKNTQLGNSEFKIGGAKRQNFTEIYKNSKKHMPSSAHYKYETKTFDRLSMSPKALKVKRH